MLNKNKQKYIFVSGGVLSGLGKGVTAASLGYLLKNRGYDVTNIKCENYLNLDSGNINPIEHGDVFLCEDGTEADLDLGTYERFLDQEVGALNYTTIGQIYSKVINDTKNAKYEGLTVDAIPYIPEEVIRRIKEAGRNHDIVLVELGGTAGEYQNIVYYEAYRILKLQMPSDVIHVHVTYFPYLDHVNELKAKPTQLSVKQLQGMGIQPDFIVGRSPIYIDEKRKEKVAFYCNMTKDDVISNPDCDSIYQIPLIFAEQFFDIKALNKLGLKPGKEKLSEWRDMVTKITSSEKKELQIGIISPGAQNGEIELADAYISLFEAVKHACILPEIKPNFVFIDADTAVDNQALLSNLSSIICPDRINACHADLIKMIIEQKVPFIGINGGFLSIIDFVQNFTQKEKIDTLKAINIPKGGQEINLEADSLISNIYRANTINERQRKVLIISDEMQKELQAAGFSISGYVAGSKEPISIELPVDVHPLFIAIQSHPEYKTAPLSPHPLFQAFVSASMKKYSGKNK